MLKVSERTCTGNIFWEVGDHFQDPKVSEGTCMVLRAYLPIIRTYLLDDIYIYISLHIYVVNTDSHVYGDRSICS